MEIITYLPTRSNAGTDGVGAEVQQLWHSPKCKYCDSYCGPWRKTRSLFSNYNLIQFGHLNPIDALGLCLLLIYHVRLPMYTIPSA